MASGDRDRADEGPEAEGASDSRRDPLIGSVVNGKYRVESAIARGGMGRIYYATQVPLERPVALKVVQGDGAHEHESQFLKRFLQEASILAKLQHPNVVTLFDYGRIEGSHIEQYFIAMEFLAGETLTHRLKMRGRLSVVDTLILARQIVRGLREAHKRGVVHRDLKPSNIIIVPEGDGSEIVKLVDFGIGKVLGRPDGGQDLTQDGVFVGTPRYMAPEQFEGAAYPASDLYALGTILFQALAGRLPFVGSTMADFMVAKLARDVPTIREVAPDSPIPDAFENLIMHLLARKPEDRPAMEQLSAHLGACEEEVFGPSHSMRNGNSSGPHVFHQTGPYNLRGTGSGPQLLHSSGQIPSITGSGAIAALGHHPQQLRVPPTMVAPIPQLAHFTPSPMASTASLQPEPPKASRAPLVIAMLVLAMAAVGLVVYLQAVKSPPVAAAPPPATAPSAPTSTTAEPGSSAAFTLTIDSAPPGATVSEGENTLGETPVKIAIDRASVASGPRTFIVMKKGFAPSHLVQGPSTDNVRSVVSLAPATLAPEGSSAVKSRPTAKPPVTAAAPPTGPATDIRLKR